MSICQQKTWRQQTAAITRVPTNRRHKSSPIRCTSPHRMAQLQLELHQNPRAPHISRASNAPRFQVQSRLTVCGFYKEALFLATHHESPLISSMFSMLMPRMFGTTTRVLSSWILAINGSSQFSHTSACESKNRITGNADSSAPRTRAPTMPSCISRRTLLIFCGGSLRLSRAERECTVTSSKQQNAKRKTHVLSACCLVRGKCLEIYSGLRTITFFPSFFFLFFPLL